MGKNYGRPIKRKVNKEKEYAKSQRNNPVNRGATGASKRLKSTSYLPKRRHKHRIR